MARTKKAVRHAEVDTEWHRIQRCHNLDTSELETRASAGDGVAEDALRFRMIVKDLATNPRSEYERPQLQLAPYLWLEFKKDHTGRVRVWLELKESLTVDVIKTHFSKIRRWQQLLTEWQGPEEKWGRDKYLARLNWRHEQGLSYSELADDVAADAASWLELYRSRMGGEEFEEALRRIDRWSDDDVRHWKAECAAALSYFRYVGVLDEDLIREWWLETLRTMMRRSCRPSIPPQNPLTGERVRNTLRTFRQDRRSK